MAETKIIHATKKAEDAVTKFIKSDIRNEQTAKCNIAGNNVKRSSSNTAEAPGHVLMARTLVHLTIMALDRNCQTRNLTPERSYWKEVLSLLPLLQQQ